MTALYYHRFELLGHNYLLAATANGLAFVGSRDKGLSEIKLFYADSVLIDDEIKLNEYANEILSYLKGDKKSFNCSLDISGTSFQMSVWEALQKIPYGQVKTYTQIAKKIGRPKSVRAVGSAIGKNPVLMVIPCHRVVTKDLKIGQYRGGVEMKRDLLNLESHPR